MESFPGPAIARAGNGVCYGYFERSQAAAEWMRRRAGTAGRLWSNLRPTIRGALRTMALRGRAILKS